MWISTKEDQCRNAYLRHLFMTKRLGHQNFEARRGRGRVFIIVPVVCQSF